MSLNQSNGREHHNKQALLATMHNVLQELESTKNNWDSVFPGKEKRLYQIEHIQAVIDGLIRKIKGNINKKAVAVIAPPAAGKTFEMLILAKLMLQQGIPSIIGMWNTSNIYSPDGALQLFREFFGDDKIGVVDANNSDFSKPITFITGNGFSNKNSQFPQYDRLNIMLDEGDTFQTDMRQKALDTLIARSHAFVSLFSATKVLNQRSITEWADIVAEMPLTELIKLGYAKHIEGYYYTGDIHITDDNIVNGEVVYNTLSDVEKKRLVNSTYQIYQENPNKKMLIHCQNVDQCKQTYDKFSQHGVPVEYVTKKVSDEVRRNIEKEYIDGDLLVLISCDIYGRGFSDKGVTETEVFAEISGSATKVYQKIMRGGRPHLEHNFLKIYQLLPSTIKTRAFVPVLMHQCFNIDIGNLDYRITSHPHTDVRRVMRPIVFVSFSNDASPILPITPSNGDPEQLPSTPSDHDTNDSIQYAHIDQIRSILSTKNDYKHFLMNKYIQDHFIELVDVILKDKDIRILDIQKIASQQQNFIIGAIQIDNEEIELTYFMFRSAIYQIVSGGLKNQADHNAGVVNAIIIQWYMTGEPPVYNTVKDLLGVAGKRRSTAPMRDKYVHQHALALLDNFASIGVKREDPPHRHKSQVIEHHTISIRYAQFLTSVLAHCLGGSNKNIAHDNNVLAHDLVWSWKETGVCPDNIAEKLIQHICSLVDYVKWDFKSIYESFLSKYAFNHDDVKFTFAHDDKVSFTVTKDRFKKYIQHKKIKMTDERIDEKFPHDVMTSIELIWRDITRMVIRSPFSPEYLKSNNLTRSRINYNNSMQSKLVEHMLNGTLTDDIALGLINGERNSTELLSAEDYYLIKNLDIILTENSINRDVSREELNKPIIRINCPKHGEKYISITSLLSSFIVYITGKDVRSLTKESGMAEITFKMNIARPLLLKYVDSSPENRRSMSYKDVKKVDAFYKEKAGKSSKGNCQIDYKKLIFNENEFLNRPQLRKKLLDTLFADIDTLISFGLDKDRFQYLYDLLFTESKKKSLIDDMKEKPTSFLDHWLHMRIWEDVIGPNNSITSNDISHEEVPSTIGGDNYHDDKIKQKNDSERTQTRKKMEFNAITHNQYHYTTREELSSIVSDNFFVGKSNIDRYNYFNALSQKWNEVNIKLRKSINKTKETVFQFVNTANLLEILVPYIKGIANELEQSLGISKIRTNTRFLKNNTIGTNQYVISDLLVDKFLKNKSFFNVVKEYVDSIEYNKIDEESDDGLNTTTEMGQDTIEEDANVHVDDIYDIPTPADIKNMISSCITSKGERNQKQWNMIQHNLNPQRVVILNQMNLGFLRNAMGDDIYEYLHNMYIRKIYYNNDSYQKDKYKLLNTNNHVYIKEYIVAMYSIIDKLITNTKTKKTYSKEIALLVMDYKKKISASLSLQYDDIMKLSTDKIQQCGYDNVGKAFVSFDELLEYVKMI